MFDDRSNHAGSAMKDMREQLQRLRVQIAECEMIRGLATEAGERDLFTRLAEPFVSLGEPKHYR